MPPPTKLAVFPWSRAASPPAVARLVIWKTILASCEPDCNGKQHFLAPRWDIAELGFARVRSGQPRWGSGGRLLDHRRIPDSLWARTNRLSRFRCPPLTDARARTAWNHTVLTAGRNTGLPLKRPWTGRKCVNSTREKR